MDRGHYRGCHRNVVEEVESVWKLTRPESLNQITKCKSNVIVSLKYEIFLRFGAMDLLGNHMRRSKQESTICCPNDTSLFFRYRLRVHLLFLLSYLSIVKILLHRSMHLKIRSLLYIHTQYMYYIDSEGKNRNQYLSL